MISRLLQIVDWLTSSYWFVPSIMAGLAFSVAILLTRGAWAYDPGLQQLLAVFPEVGPEGARTVMGTIAGSMITVAGVTFSITISTIVHASSQFGPRLLTNFMQDRGNQFTLGTFIATFLYCIVVLSQIQSSEGEAVKSIPILAISLGLALAILSVLVLIYFVHHVPASIHASFVIASVGRQLMTRVDELYEQVAAAPTNPGNSQLLDIETLKRFESGETQRVQADFSGYVQFLDYDGLIELAAERDWIFKLNIAPGDYVHAGDLLLSVNDSAPLSPEEESALCDMVLFGDRRTPAQDALFLANELVEIAARALSPGINDPFTAMMCIDWLGSAFATVANRTGKQAFRHDKSGDLRVVTPCASESEFVTATLLKLMPYACRDRNASFHLQALLAKLILTAQTEQTVEQLMPYFESIPARAKSYLSDSDVDLMEQRRYTIAACISKGDDKHACYCDNRWVVKGV